MNTENTQLDIQNAISDIAIIKQVLNKTEQDQIDNKLVGITLSANMLLQSLALIGALSLCLWEIFSGNSMTQTLMVAREYNDLRIYEIGFMGAILIGLLIPFYFVIWRASKHNGEGFTTYIVRNFKYLKNLSFFSDLLMKFVGIALIVLAAKTEWVAPLLVAYTGDYLLQQRFFTLSIKASALLGLSCIAIAAVLFFSGSYSLITPLAIFTLIATISVAKLVIKYRQLETADE